MDWLLYDKGLRHERVKELIRKYFQTRIPDQFSSFLKRLQETPETYLKKVSNAGFFLRILWNISDQQYFKTILEHHF